MNRTTYNKEWHIRNRTRIRVCRQARIQRNRELMYRAKCRPCMDCGIQYNPWIMDFDHRDSSTKEFTIGQRANRAVVHIVNEISKCDVVCSNCHRERTHKRKNLDPQQ